MFSPYQGRFITLDPIGLAGGDVNQYRGMENNPVNRLDPSGLASIPPGGELPKDQAHLMTKQGWMDFKAEIQPHLDAYTENLKKRDASIAKVHDVKSYLALNRVQIIGIDKLINNLASINCPNQRLKNLRVDLLEIQKKNL